MITLTAHAQGAVHSLPAVQGPKLTVSAVRHRVFSPLAPPRLLVITYLLVMQICNLTLRTTPLN